MDLDGFWALVERSGRKKADPEERAEWLTKKLRKMPPADIEDFQLHLDGLRDRTDTYQMWGAAYLICGGCSDDAFWYFQGWLVGQGREIHRRAVADPDSLAELRVVRGLAAGEDDEDDCPEWESLDYAATEAYEEHPGSAQDLDEALKARGHVFRSSPAPAGEGWDLEDDGEAARRYPALARLFG